MNLVSYPQKTETVAGGPESQAAWTATEARTKFSENPKVLQAARPGVVAGSEGGRGQS